jgi:hypothetical protein
VETILIFLPFQGNVLHKSWKKLISISPQVSLIHQRKLSNTLRSSYPAH